MIRQILPALLAISIISAPLAAKERPPHEERESAIFWTSVSASGLLFIGAVGCYATADYYEDKISALSTGADDYDDKSSEYALKASTFWTSALLCMGASTATLLFGMKRRYDADSPLAVVPHKDGTPVLAYRYHF